LPDVIPDLAEYPMSCGHDPGLNAKGLSSDIVAPPNRLRIVPDYDHTERARRTIRGAFQFGGLPVPGQWFGDLPGRPL
jgi:hypothetical protein